MRRSSYVTVAIGTVIIAASLLAIRIRAGGEKQSPDADPMHAQRLDELGHVEPCLDTADLRGDELTPACRAHLDALVADEAYLPAEARKVIRGGKHDELRTFVLPRLRDNIGTLLGIREQNHGKDATYWRVQLALGRWRLAEIAIVAGVRSPALVALAQPITADELRALFADSRTR